MLPFVSLRGSNPRVPVAYSHTTSLSGWATEWWVQVNKLWFKAQARWEVRRDIDAPFQNWKHCGLTDARMSRSDGNPFCIPIGSVPSLFCMFCVRVDLHLNLQQSCVSWTDNTGTSIRNLALWSSTVQRSYIVVSIILHYQDNRLPFECD